jgi:hypothetical protein
VSGILPILRSVYGNATPTLPQLPVPLNQPLTPTPTPPLAPFYRTLAQTLAQIPGAAPPHFTSERISRPPPKVKIEPGVVVIDLTLDESDNEREDTHHTPNRKLEQPVVNDGGGADAGADEEDASPGMFYPAVALGNEVANLWTVKSKHIALEHPYALHAPRRHHRAQH